MEPFLDTTFASRSVRAHLVRGAIGLPLVVAAFVLLPWAAPWSLLLLVPAVVALRGCPTCWALGLGQTRAACAMPQDRGRPRDGSRDRCSEVGSAH